MCAEVRIDNQVQRNISAALLMALMAALTVAPSFAHAGFAWGS